MGLGARSPQRPLRPIREPDYDRLELAEFFKTRAAHIGYEIQRLDGESGKYLAGSIDTFVASKPDSQRRGEWNSMEIESRNEVIRVRINWVTGCGTSWRIGLQSHDQFLFMLFGIIRIREWR